VNASEVGEDKGVSRTAGFEPTAPLPGRQGAAVRRHSHVVHNVVERRCAPHRHHLPIGRNGLSTHSRDANLRV
jgi:hypothetical protein